MHKDRLNSELKSLKLHIRCRETRLGDLFLLKDAVDDAIEYKLGLKGVEVI